MRSAWLAVAFAIVTAHVALAAPGDISTVTSALSPVDVVEASDGSLLIAERNRVQRVAPDGSVATVAGGAAEWNSPLGDGGPAIGARLEPAALAALPDGGFLVADHGSYSVRRVFPDGHIETVAGGGHNGDGCMATRAQLGSPRGLSVTGDGGFLIADWSNDRIARVWPDGSLTTVAGDPAASGTADGSPALDTDLGGPSDVSATPDGGFLVADTMNAIVQRITPDGRSFRAAGSGVWDFAGDGGAATTARLNHPTGVAAVAGGGFLIADQYNHRIRRVLPNGTIETIAGSGLSGTAHGGFAGDGGPATGARLNLPTAVSMKRSGGVLISDWWNNRIRAVEGQLRPAPPPAPAGFRGTGGYTGACLGLDPSFSGGSVTQRAESAADLVLQQDGRIVTAGGGLVDERYVFLRRFLADGRVDTSFGNGGSVSSPKNSRGSPVGIGYLSAIAEQPGTGGKLIVVGSHYDADGRHEAVVARYTPDGQPDLSFGVNGRVAFGALLGVNVLDVESDGKIVVGGSGSNASTGYVNRWLVARLSPTGQLDRTFGGDGIALGTTVGEVSGVAGLGDGRVVVSSEVGTGRPGHALLAARYRADGELDTTFGEGGKAAAYPPADGEAQSHGVVVQRDGRIIVAGWEEHHGTDGGRHMMAARFTPQGKLDPTFSGDGIAIVTPTGVEGTRARAAAHALALQPDGKLVLGGTGSSSPWSAYGFAVMRLTGQGEPDPTFGPGGGLFTPMDLGGVGGVAVQPDGKIVAAGTTGWDLGLARYLPQLRAGAPPDQGTATTPLGRDPGGKPQTAAYEPVTPTLTSRGGERGSAPIALASLSKPPSLVRLARRGWPVRVRVSRPGVVSLRLALRRGGKARSVVLAGGARRVHPGTSRVLLRPRRAVRSRLVGRGTRRLKAVLRARLVEDGGAHSETMRRVLLRAR